MCRTEGEGSRNGAYAVDPQKVRIAGRVGRVSLLWWLEAVVFQVSCGKNSAPRNCIRRAAFGELPGSYPGPVERQLPSAQSGSLNCWYWPYAACRAETAEQRRMPSGQFA